VTDADVRFHALIVATSQNHALERTFDQLAPFARTFITLTLPDVDVRGIVLEHQLILRALQDRDSERAAEAARMHQCHVSELLQLHFPSAAEGFAGSDAEALGGS
jgi:DNA-binding GntR family transcriptional regulator